MPICNGWRCMIRARQGDDKMSGKVVMGMIMLALIAATTTLAIVDPTGEAWKAGAAGTFLAGILLMFALDEE